MAITDHQIDTTITHPQQRPKLPAYGRELERLIEMRMADTECGRLQGKALIGA